MTVMNLNLKQPEDRAITLQAGDHLVIDAITITRKTSLQSLERFATLESFLGEGHEGF